jgi:hypothetical protein
VTWLRAVGVIALLVLGLAGCGGGDRKAYVKANETLFEQLPRFPGSRVENETTTAYRANESGPVAGYSTRFDLTLPSQATAGDVGSFYRRRLGPQWRLVENLGGLVLNGPYGREAKNSFQNEPLGSFDRRHGCSGHRSREARLGRASLNYGPSGEGLASAMRLSHRGLKLYGPSQCQLRPPR